MELVEMKYASPNATGTSSYFTTADNVTYSTPSVEQWLIDEKMLREVFSNGEAITLAVVLGYFSLFGIIANVVTFFVIFLSPKLYNSVFNIFLLSLCVSDFLSAINSPFVLYRATWGFYEWKIPHIFCKIGIAVDFWTSCVTIQHILIFSILRLVSIKFPHHFNRIKPLHAKIIVIFIWVEMCLGSFVVYFLWPGVFPPGGRTPNGMISKACTAQPQWIGMLMTYVKYGFVFVLYAPMIGVVIVTTLLAGLIIKRKRDKIKVVGTLAQQKSNRKENYALLQLTLIILSFMLGYIPDIAYRITAITIRAYNSSLLPRVEWQFTITAHCILRLSECLNPMFYNLASSNMRKETLNFLHRILPCVKLSPSPDSMHVSKRKPLSTALKNISSK